ncbi:MAG: DUF2589 domain-containing protein [Oscillospiraceae bacterium]|nr:DUF2589 domain-containing protein [Oscillospiraceae bacterium]
MYIPFETLVEQLGRSIQEAQGHLEREAAESFFRCFETVNDSSGSCEVPLTRRLKLPAGDGMELKSVDVPVAALLRHQAMGLDSVTVRVPIKTQLRAEDNVLLVEACPAAGEDGAESPGEAEFTFKAAPPAEGIARLDLNVQKVL